jgi:hypothetical protein
LVTSFVEGQAVGKVLLRQGVETATRRETRGERPTSGEIGKDLTAIKHHLIAYEI